MSVFRLHDSAIIFPNPELADPNGLLAIGGDLSPLRLLTAYATGIFPWYNEEEPILWWSLNPRLICIPDEAVFSKSLLKRVHRKEYEIKIDANFRQVMEGCAFVTRINQDGTWITQDVIEAYCKLHELGFAHSFETYKNGELVGGLYGLSIGGMFAGESMFHLQTDASKFAFYYLIQAAKMLGLDFIDCQQVTAHLQTLGAKPVQRKIFLKYLKNSMEKESFRGKWGKLVIC